MKEQPHQIKPSGGRGLCLPGITSRSASLLAVWIMTGCATDPAVVAMRNAEGAALTTRVWYQASSAQHFMGHSFDSDAVCKFEPDGSGIVSSRRSGYTKPMAKMGAVTGCGAYSELITWPISWEPTGNGEYEVTCEGGPISTGPNYSNGNPLELVSAKRSGDTLVLHYINGIRATYHAVNSNDPRLNPTQAALNRRTSAWASKGPALLAKTEKNKPSSSTTDDLVNAVGDEGLIMSYQDDKKQAQKNGGITRVTVRDSWGNVIFSRRDTYPKP